MSQEQSYTAIILKKQPLGESDELVTFYTLGQGKMRGLAKSVKLPKAKLAYSLQVLYMVEIRLAGGGLPKIIAAQPIETFANIRNDLQAMAHAYYALELCLKFTPDEQKNDKLFFALEHFFRFLHEYAGQEVLYTWGLAKCKIDFLEALGFGVHTKVETAEGDIFFSNHEGGFTTTRSPGARAVEWASLQQYRDLATRSWQQLPTNLPAGNPNELNTILSEFLEYHLEREIKSEKYLKAGM